VNGDNQMQVSDMVTSRSAIGVAAYNSKTFYTNVSGQNINYTGFTKGAIASFSSHGPTADGRVKPDIAGPGMALASSVSSADSSLMPGGTDYNMVASKFVSPLNGQTYSYAVFQGTSMSSPAVSGIVALLLEVNPNLTPTEIRDILAQTAITDNYTGIIPTGGSNTWGFGKANAYAAIKKTLETVGIFHSESSLSCLVYPNPNKGIYSIQFTAAKTEPVLLTVYNNAGVEIMHEQWQVISGNNTHQIDLNAYPSGIYFTRINTGNYSSVIKIVKQ
jgi:subtilisin family serine protease